MQYFFILGRSPELSILEIISSVKPLAKPWLLDVEELESIVRTWCWEQQAGHPASLQTAVNQRGYAMGASCLRDIIPVQIRSGQVFTY